MNIKRAFISVHDKTDIEKLGRYLAKNGVEIVATDHTAEYLDSFGVRVSKVGDYTGFPPVFDGRLKSLHPKVIGGSWRFRIRRSTRERWRATVFSLSIWSW